MFFFKLTTIYRKININLLKYTIGIKVRGKK